MPGHTYRFYRNVRARIGTVFYLHIVVGGRQIARCIDCTGTVKQSESAPFRVIPCAAGSGLAQIIPAGPDKITDDLMMLLYNFPVIHDGMAHGFGAAVDTIRISGNVLLVARGTVIQAENIYIGNQLIRVGGTLFAFRGTLNQNRKEIHDRIKAGGALLVKIGHQILALAGV